MSAKTEWVDYAKAVGILLVVYGHVARGIANASLPIDSEIYRFVDHVIYSFHMPLFFFLSGLFFVDSLSRRGAKALVFSKVDSILYPYIVWSLIQGFIELALSSQTSGEVSLAEVLGLWAPRAQFWFLYVLFVAFVLSAIVYSVAPKHSRLPILLLLACAAYFLLRSVIDPEVVRFFGENFVFFACGIAFARYELQRACASSTAQLAWLGIFVAAQFLFHAGLGMTYHDKGLGTLILGLLSIFWVVALSIWLSAHQSKWLAHIGGASMAIYLMHILAGSGTRIALERLFGVESVAVHLMIGFLAAVGLPLLALKIIQAAKIPFVFSAPLSRWLRLSAKPAG